MTETTASGKQVLTRHRDLAATGRSGGQRRPRDGRLLHEARLLRAANFVRRLPPADAQMQWTGGRPQSIGFCITEILGLRLASELSRNISAQSMESAARTRTSKARASRKQASDSKAALPSGNQTAPLLPFRPGRGGARPGSGRKPNIPGQPGVDHRPRTPLASRFPVHVTLKLRSGLPRLRSRPAYEALRAAFAAGCARNLSGAFRLCHYAVLNDHLHLICEAEGRQALSRGLQGLLIRIARALNKLWSRRGSVFADRYHDHVLKSPREVRNALRYVFGNGKQHAAEGREVNVPQAIDTFTSAPWFGGFRERITVRGIEAVVRPVTDARTWLLTEGWLRHGRLSVHEVPVTA